MLEVLLNGFFLNEPHQVGAGGAVVRSDDHEILRIAQAFGPGDVSTWCAAEIATLTLALEQLRKKWYGEEILVRTGLTSISDIVSGRAGRAPADGRAWLIRLATAARDFAHVQAITSHGWVTVRAQDLALRTALDHAIACKKAKSIPTARSSAP